MFAMVVLIIAVFVYGITIRVKAARSGVVHPSYFKVFDARGKDIPVRLQQLKNHAENLFQMPMVFLIAGSVSLHFEPDFVISFLAWCYVALRVIHSFVHLTYNHVIHRLSAFVLSNICLMIIWIRLVFVLS